MRGLCRSEGDEERGRSASGDRTAYKKTASLLQSQKKRSDQYKLPLRAHCPSRKRTDTSKKNWKGARARREPFGSPARGVGGNLHSDFFGPGRCTSLFE
jgi:hypothetical protein